MSTFLIQKKSVEELKVENRKKIQELCVKEFLPVSNWIKKNHGTEEDSKDIFYDAIIIVLSKMDSGTLVLNCELSTFFFSVCKHLWYHEYRKRVKLSLTDTIDDKLIDSPYDDTEDKKHQLFISLFDKLDKKSKELFKHVFEQKSYSEIACIMNFKNAQAVADKKKNCIKRMTSELINSSEYKEQLDEISDIYRGNSF